MINDRLCGQILYSWPCFAECYLHQELVHMELECKPVWLVHSERGRVQLSQVKLGVN